MIISEADPSDGKTMMKHILRSAATSLLILGIASTGLAFSSITFEPFPIAAVEKPTKKKKRRRSRRQTSTIPYMGGNKIIRVRRLSARERRDVFRRLIDIRIN